MKTWNLIAAGLLLALTFSLDAQARPGGFGGPGSAMGPALMLEHMADHLDLTDTQRAELDNIIAAARPEAEALREQFRENREALASLDANDPATSAELNNLALSNGELATQGTLLAARVRSDVYAMLTEEQIEKLERSKERMQKRFAKRFERN